jgi:cyclase
VNSRTTGTWAPGRGHLTAAGGAGFERLRAKGSVRLSETVPQVTHSRHFEIQRLAAGVYAAIAKRTGAGLCNSTIVDLGGETLVFDSMLTPMAGEDLARSAERLTGRKPAWVVNSHWHGDHIWGNGSFPGGHVVSTRKVREVVLRRSRQQFKDNRRQFPEELRALERPDSPISEVERVHLRAWFRGVLATPLPFQIVPPEVTFREELVLEGSRRSIHLLSYGGGHSPSDVFGYLPDEGILLAGDLLMEGLHPSVGDGWPDRWVRILRRVERLRPRQVVPGHGPIGDFGTIRRNREYLGELSRSAGVAVRRKLPLSEFLSGTRMPRRYRRWEFSFMYPDNLARAYRLARLAAHRA